MRVWQSTSIVSMRPASVIAAILLATTIATPPANAYDHGLPINGTYTATSNGAWSKTDDVYRDEATVRSTWTVTSSCDSPQSCTGRVVSDQGWETELNWRTDRWVARHQVPDWEKCPDGTAFPGDQIFRFVPTDPRTGRVTIPSNLLSGEDYTIGVPGACGDGDPLVIRMPFTLVKID